jgi:hypothetical protein
VDSSHGRYAKKDNHHDRFVGRLLAVLVALSIVLAPVAWAADEPAPSSEPTQTEVGQAAADDSQFHTDGRLEPTYPPREPEPPPGWYNASYLFGMTRSVAASTMSPGAKVPLFVLTVPLDIVFLPFAAIGGLFG